MKNHLDRIRQGIAVLAHDLKRRHLFPWHDGTARFGDPTYGRIDRDIQWQVNDFFFPSSHAQRCALENTLQDRRNRGLR